MRRENEAVVVPDAPIYTKSGNMKTTQSVSYKPFIHKRSAPPIRGTAKRPIIIIVHIQKAPLILSGLKIRDNNKPAEKAKIKRKKPPSISLEVMEKPTHKSPRGPKTANAPKAQAEKATKSVSFLVDNL